MSDSETDSESFVEGLQYPRNRIATSISGPVELLYLQNEAGQKIVIFVDYHSPPTALCHEYLASLPKSGSRTLRALQDSTRKVEDTMLKIHKHVLEEQEGDTTESEEEDVGHNTTHKTFPRIQHVLMGMYRVRERQKQTVAPIFVSDLLLDVARFTTLPTNILVEVSTKSVVVDKDPETFYGNTPEGEVTTIDLVADALLYQLDKYKKSKHARVVSADIRDELNRSAALLARARDEITALDLLEIYFSEDTLSVALEYQIRFFPDNRMSSDEMDDIDFPIKPIPGKILKKMLPVVEQELDEIKELETEEWASEYGVFQILQDVNMAYRITQSPAVQVLGYLGADHLAPLGRLLKTIDKTYEGFHVNNREAKKSRRCLAVRDIVID